MRLNRTLIARSIGLLLLVMASSAWALDNQWYFGLGGGVSLLQPNPDEPGLNIENNQGTLGSLILGRDIDDRSSAQLQLYHLGESELTDGQRIPYAAIDASVLYRFYDTFDRQPKGRSLSAALYGRFGVGYAQRDTNIELGNREDIYFGLGGGAEFFLTRSTTIRVEAFYHDQDIASAQLMLVKRFGGTRAQPRLPVQVGSPEVPGPKLPTPKLPNPGVQAEPESIKFTDNRDPLSVLMGQTQSIPNAKRASVYDDRDNDGIADTTDDCLDSASGYPVNESGCPLFNGVLSGVRFMDGTSDLAASATVQLNYLANLLKRYPDARIELLAHTDSRGDVRSQSILTRGRLRSIGTYLIGQGIRANRLVLRSFGGSRPIYDNSTTQGLLGNNRIEVNEHHASK